MKALILIGDSIRMGYQPLVVKKLEGRFDVWGPEKNGGTSRNVLNNLDAWAIRRPADIIHVNCGLHDLKREGDRTATFVPMYEYEQNVRRILERLKKETRARILWAMTTPVIDEWHLRTKKFERREAEVLAYNALALPVAQELGVEVNDLHAIVQGAGLDKCLQPDGVHMNDLGNELLAEAVARRIESGDRTS